jgi:hypothetical protein
MIYVVMVNLMLKRLGYQRLRTTSISLILRHNPGVAMVKSNICGGGNYDPTPTQVK